ncbi:MAG: hypothetical protein WBX00_04700 [Isosphaeraceae bacterium]
MLPRRVRKTKKRPDHHTATPSPACDLLAGADVNARSRPRTTSTPRRSAGRHGSEHGWHRRTGNYPAVAAALLEAGAMLLETASGADPVKEVLHRHGSKGGIA